MPAAPMGAVLRHVSRLFGAGTVAGLAPDQLLDRFVRHQDEVAFAALVERYGPMVLGVCRRLTRDAHAADDAFQATFLVLVRRARSIRDRDRLGNWLYGVAVRVSLKVKADQTRHRLREREVDLDRTPAPEPATTIGCDHATLLHEELAKLPAKYRAPLMMCFLDGQTHDQAATQLGWPIGTVKGRIARAKTLLQTRLGRRGVTLSTAAVAATLTESARAAVPAILLNQTTQAAMAIAAGGTIAAGACSASAILLSREVVTAMTLTKLKFAAIALVSLGTVATGAGVMARQGIGGAGRTAEAEQQEVRKLGEPNPEPKNAAAGDPEGKTAVGTTKLPTAAFSFDAIPPTDRIPQHPLFAKQLAKLPPLGQLPSVQALRASRVRDAEQILNASLILYILKTQDNPNSDSTDVYDAMRSLREARDDLAASDVERVKIVEEYVNNIRALIRMDQEQLKPDNKNTGLMSLYEGKPRLAEAEMMLVRARESAERAEVGAADGKPGNTGPPDAERPSDDPSKDEAINKALEATINMPFGQETPARRGRQVPFGTPRPSLACRMVSRSTLIPRG